MEDNIYFSEIMKLECCEDIKKIINEWNVLSTNLTAFDHCVDVNLPAMLWYSKPGVGTTRLLELICGFLEKKDNLIKFSGDTKYFEFSLDYCESKAPFPSFARLIDTVHDAAGFRESFSGLIRIDIDEWKHHFKEDHFINFIEYICDISKTNVIILSIEDEPEAVQNLEAFLSTCMRIKTVKFTHPSPKVYLDFLIDLLKKNNISITEEAKSIIFASIEKLKSNPYFDGYKSIENLAQDMIYAWFSSDDCFRSDLSDTLAKRFSPESEYIRRTITSPKIIKKIGFN